MRPIERIAEEKSIRECQVPLIVGKLYSLSIIMRLFPHAPQLKWSEECPCDMARERNPLYCHPMS